MTDLDTHELVESANEHLAVLDRVLDLLDVTVTQLVDRDSLAAVLYALRDVKRRAAEVYSACERALLSEAGDKSFVVPNLGKFEVKRSTKRSGWRHDELVPVLVSKAMEERHFDGTSGEVESEGHAVARVLRDCISFGAGKVTGLRDRGIQADEYCQVDEASYSVQLPPPVLS